MEFEDKMEIVKMHDVPQFPRFTTLYQRLLLHSLPRFTKIYNGLQ